MCVESRHTRRDQGAQRTHAFDDTAADREHTFVDEIFFGIAGLHRKDRRVEDHKHIFHVDRRSITFEAGNVRRVLDDNLLVLEEVLDARDPEMCGVVPDLRLALSQLRYLERVQVGTWKGGQRRAN